MQNNKKYPYVIYYVILRPPIKSAGANFCKKQVLEYLWTLIYKGNNIV